MAKHLEQQELDRTRAKVEELEQQLAKLQGQQQEEDPDVVPREQQAARARLADFLHCVERNQAGE